MADAKRGHLSPIRLCEDVAIASAPDCLTGQAKKGFEWLRDRIDVREQRLFAVLKRLVLVNGPTEHAFENEICQTHLPNLPKCRHLNAETLNLVLEALISRVSVASSLVSGDSSRHFVGIAKGSDSDPYLIAKRISESMIAEVITEAIQKTLALAQQSSVPLIASKYVLISSGFFLLGSDQGLPHESPQRKTKVRSFYFGVFPVTNADFCDFIEDTGYLTTAEQLGSGLALRGTHWVFVEGANFRHPQGGNSSIDRKASHPVVQVSWHDVVAYCRWLSKRTGRRVSLPTEAEWEFAAKCGDERIWAFGNEFGLEKVNAEGTDTSGFRDYAPNTLGLYDMSGNVYEWCVDWYSATQYAENYGRILVDPTGPDEGQERILRGGSWFDMRADVRCAHRFSADPSLRASNWGFRCRIEPEVIENDISEQDTLNTGGANLGL